MARAGQFQEVFRRPYQQKQSQKRSHLQLQLRIRLQRHQRPLSFAPRPIGLSRVPTRSMRREGLPFGKSHLDHALNRELSCGAGELPESETRLRHLSHFQDSVRSPRRIRNAAATESDPDAAAITLETPYTGSSSRPLQSPFGPYPYLAAAAATSRSFGGGSAETKSLQLTFA